MLHVFVAVNRVLAKAPLLYNKKQIKVEVFQADDDNTEGAESGEEQEAESDGCTIEVRGYKDTTSQDTIEMYFENTRRSGGGELEKIEEDEDEGMYLLTFESKEGLEFELFQDTKKIIK